MINYLKADATIPQTEGNIIISHICNDIGAWGKGFVMAISKRWKGPAKQYKQWYKEGEDFALGACSVRGCRGKCVGCQYHRSA